MKDPRDTMSASAPSYAVMIEEMARRHYVITGIVIVVAIIVMMHVWAHHIRTPPSERVLRCLYETPGWTIHGTSPSVEIIPMRITPTMLIYDVRYGGRFDSRYQAVVTPLDDGIMTCTGLHIRPCGDELEVAIGTSTKFTPLHRMTTIPS